MTATQITGGLYIADIQDIRERDTSNFDHVIGVCQDDCSDNLADGSITQGHVPGEYSYEMLSEAIDAVIAARIRRETVCVHCHCAQSRSVTVATAAMAVLDGISWDESYDKTKDARPIINPGPELVSDGKRYVEEHE